MGKGRQRGLNPLTQSVSRSALLCPTREILRVIRGPAPFVLSHLWIRAERTCPRSLVTIAALAAMGDDDQLHLYLRRGLESGLTRGQITEALTHLAFYAGWTRATKAMAAVTRTLGK